MENVEGVNQRRIYFHKLTAHNHNNFLLWDWWLRVRIIESIEWFFMCVLCKKMSQMWTKRKWRKWRNGREENAEKGGGDGAQDFGPQNSSVSLSLNLIANFTAFTQITIHTTSTILYHPKYTLIERKLSTYSTNENNGNFTVKPNMPI